MGEGSFFEEVQSALWDFSIHGVIAGDGSAVGQLVVDIAGNESVQKVQGLITDGFVDGATLIVSGNAVVHTTDEGVFPDGGFWIMITAAADGAIQANLVLFYTHVGIATGGDGDGTIETLALP